MNAYVGYILDGSLVRHTPDAAGRPVAIVVYCSEAPTTEIEAVFASIRAQLLQYSIGFRVQLQSQPS